MTAFPPYIFTIAISAPSYQPSVVAGGFGNPLAKPRDIQESKFV